MTDELELAWAAGFFEGEGSVFVHSSPSYPVAASLDQTEGEALIRRFHAAVGKGKVYGPYTTASGRLRWRWAAFGDPADDVMWHLEPYLGEHSAKVRRWKELV